MVIQYDVGQGIVLVQPAKEKAYGPGFLYISSSAKGIGRNNIWVIYLYSISWWVSIGLSVLSQGETQGKSIRMGIITQRYRLLCASSVAHSLFVRSLMKRKMIANGHRTPDNLLLETERNNVQQVFILTRNRPLNGVQTRVYFLLKQGVLTHNQEVFSLCLEWKAKESTAFNWTRTGTILTSWAVNVNQTMRIFYNLSSEAWSCINIYSLEV